MTGKEENKQLMLTQKTSKEAYNGWRRKVELKLEEIDPDNYDAWITTASINLNQLSSEERQKYHKMLRTLQQQVKEEDLTVLIPDDVKRHLGNALAGLENIFNSNHRTTKEHDKELFEKMRFDPKKNRAVDKFIQLWQTKLANLRSAGVEYQEEKLRDLLIQCFKGSKTLMNTFAGTITVLKSALRDYDTAGTAAMRNAATRKIYSIGDLAKEFSSTYVTNSQQIDQDLKQETSGGDRNRESSGSYGRHKGGRGKQEQACHAEDERTCGFCNKAGHETEKCYAFIRARKDYHRVKDKSENSPGPNSIKKELAMMAEKQNNMAKFLKKRFKGKNKNSTSPSKWPQHAAHMVDDYKSDDSEDSMYEFGFFTSDTLNSNEESPRKDEEAECAEETRTPLKKAKRAVFDSGTTVTFTPHEEELTEVSDIRDHKSGVVTANNDKVIPIHKKGKSKTVTIDKNGERLELKHNTTKLAPTFRRKLISIGACADDGNITIFGKDGCIMMKTELTHDDIAEIITKNDTGGTTTAVGTRKPGGLYLTNETHSTQKDADHVDEAYAVNPDQRRTIKTPAEIHEIAHCGIRAQREIFNNPERFGFTISKNTPRTRKYIGIDNCEPCMQAKITAATAPPNPHRASQPGEILHWDLTGKWSRRGKHGEHYGGILTDDYSSKQWTTEISRKSETEQWLRESIASIATETGNQLKVFRADGAKENFTKDFQAWIKQRGVRFEKPPPHIHTMNSRAERAIRKNKEITQAILNASETKMTENYRPAAWKFAAEINNKIPTFGPNPADQNYGKSPDERYYKKNQNMSNFLPFGSIVCAFIPSEKRKTTHGNRGFMARVIAHTNFGYIVEDLKTNKEHHVNKVIRRRQQNEADEPQATREILRPSSPDPDAQIGRVDYEKPKTRTSSRIRKRAARLSEEACKAMEKMIGKPRTAHLVAQTEDEENHQRLKKEADDQEIEGLLKRGTFRKEKIPKGKRPIPSMMTRTIKFCRATGNISRYKSRLVLRGDLQRKGIDYHTAKAKVAIFASFRLLLIIAATMDMPTVWVDVEQAFCQARMDIPTWTIPPRSTGLLTKKEEEDGYGLRVVMSLYGSHQASALWEQEYDNTLQNKLGFTRLTTDQSVYILREGDEWMVCAIHVDDSLNVGHEGLIKRTLEKLAKIYSIKQKWESDQGMGMKITRLQSHHTIVTSNPVMIEQLLEKFNIPKHTKSKPHPLSPSTKFQDMPQLQNGDHAQNQWPYLELLGALMYLALSCRPDILLAVSKAAQYCKTYNETHFHALINILKYLKGTQNWGLRLGGPSTKTTKDGQYEFEHEPFGLHGFADASFANESKGRSRTGYITKLADGIVNYHSGRQSSPAQSTTEAEYISLSEAAREMKWTQNLLHELNIGIKTLNVPMYEDNESCLRLTDNQSSHSRTKHVETKFHLIRHYKKKGEQTYIGIPSEYQTADILTKPLAGTPFQRHRDAMMIDPTNLKFDNEHPVHNNQDSEHNQNHGTNISFD